MRTIARSLSAVLAAVAVLMVVGCSNQPVAIVNGSRITKKEFYDRLEQAAGERVLADLVARRLLDDAFAKSKLQVTEQEINAEIEKMKSQAPNEAEWQNYLKQQNMTETEFREFVTFNLKVKKMAERDVKVTDEAVAQFFQENKEKFARPETVVLSEIVVTDKAKADQLYGQVKADAAAFSTVARQHSISTYTRDRGGRRPEEALVGIQPDALRQAVAGLQVGQVSRPVKADDVWYILKLEQRNAAQKADFAKIKDQVREQFVFSKAKQVPEMIEDLRKSAKDNVLLPRYQEMNRMFGPQQALPTFGEGQKGAPEGGKTPAAPAGGQQPAAPAQPAPPAGAQQPAAPVQPATPAPPAS